MIVLILLFTLVHSSSTNNPNTKYLKNIHSMYPKNINALNKNDIVSTLKLATLFMSTPLPVHAVKGAFELDAEYYFKALIGQKEQEKLMSKATPIYITPRKLDPVFASIILTTVLSCMEKIGKFPRQTILDMVDKDLPFSLKLFRLNVPIINENISDQYYFDMILYLYYFEAGKLIKTSQERVKLRNLVGDSIFDYILENYEIKSLLKYKTKNTSFSTLKNNQLLISLTKTLSYGERTSLLADLIKEVLNIYTSTNIINGYEFVDEDLYDTEYTQQTLNENLSLNYQVTVKNPATILGFIQQYKLDTFYHPEIFATVICSIARTLGFIVRFEDYLMDNYYREKNYDVQAQDILLEFGLTTVPISVPSVSAASAEA